MSIEKKFFLKDRPVLRQRKEKDGTLGRWYIEYYLTNGVQSKRVQFYGKINYLKSEIERKQFANELIATIITKHEQNRLADLPLARRHYCRADEIYKALDARRDNYRRRSFFTYQTKIGILSKWMESTGISVAHLIGKNEALRFINYLRTIRAPKTVNAYIQDLHVIFDFLIEDKLIFENPFVNIKKQKGTSEGAKYFTASEILVLKKKIMETDSVLWLCVQLLYYCFIRPGEQRLLKVGDFNLEDGCIEVRGEISKNKKTQIVVIPEVLREYLYSIDFNERSPEEYVFGNKKPLGYNTLYTRHKKILQELHFGDRYVLYSWKHTGVVRAVKNKIHIKDLQMQLRHHSLDQVDEYLRRLGVMDSDDLRNLFPAL